MKRIDLRLNEQEKYGVIKKLVETNGNKDRAAIKLDCTRRTINRMIKDIRLKESYSSSMVIGTAFDFSS